MGGVERTVEVEVQVEVQVEVERVGDIKEGGRGIDDKGKVGDKVEETGGRGSGGGCWWSSSFLNNECS